MSDTSDLTAKIGIDASVTGAESVSALAAGVGGLSQQLLQLSQSAIQNTNVQAQLNSVLKATRSSVGVLGSSIAIYRKELALSNSMVRQNTASLLALDAAQKKVAASGKMTSSLSSSYAQTASHLNSMNSSVGTLNKTMRSNAIVSFGKRLQQSGIQSQRVGMQMARNVTLPLIGIFRTAFFSYTRLEREQVRLTKLISDGFGTGEEAIIAARKAVDELNPALDKITRKFGTSRILVQSLAGDFAELGVPTNAITDLTLLTVQLEKLGNLDIGQSQQFIQSIYQNILRVKRDSAQQQGFVFDLTNAQQMTDTIEQLRGQLAIFNLMENKTTLSLKDIADAFPEMSAAATSFGLSMTETTAMLVPMVAAGFQVGASANSIKVSLQRMVAMTKQNTGIIRELNSALGPEFNLAAGVGMETIQKLTDGFNTLLSIKGEQGTLELFSRLFGVRQGPRMETAIRQFAQFQKALDTTGSAESVLAKQLEEKVNFRLKANGMEEISLKKIVDLTNLNKDSVEKVNGEYSARAKVIQDAQKEATNSLGETFSDTKDFLAKVGTEAGKGFFMEAIGGAAYAGKQMEVELQLSIDTAATRFDTLRESLMGIGRAIVPVVDVVVKAILPIVQKIEDFFKGLSATTRKFIGAFMGLALIIPMVSLLSSTFKTLFGGAIKGFGRMFMSTNGLFASLKGVKSQLVDIADIIIDPKMAKGFNSMVQYGDQALLSQDPSKAGYSTKLRGRRKMTPDLSGVDQPVRELIERGGMPDPNSLASIKSTLRGADKLGLPNTQELIASLVTDMNDVPAKIAKASADAVDKTAKTIAKTLKGTVFQNNTFVGNKFGGGAPGTTPGTTPGSRTPKSPAGGGTPVTPRSPFYPTPTGAPIVAPEPFYPTPTGAPITPSSYIHKPNPRGMFPLPTVPNYIPPPPVITHPRGSLFPGRLPIPSAATIGAPVVATVERAAAEAKAQLEALGLTVKDFTEAIPEVPKPARTRTSRAPRAPPAAPVETPADFVKPAPKPAAPKPAKVEVPKPPKTPVATKVPKEVKKAVKKATAQIKTTVEEIQDIPEQITKQVADDLKKTTNVKPRGRKTPLKVLNEADKAALDAETAKIYTAKLNAAAEAEAARVQAENLAEAEKIAAARKRAEQNAKPLRSPARSARSLRPQFATTKSAEDAQRAVKSEIAREAAALAEAKKILPAGPVGAPISKISLPTGVTAASRQFTSQTGAGKQTTLTYKEIAAWFNAESVELPKEYAFLKTMDKEIKMSIASKNGIEKALKKNIKAKKLNPFGTIKSPKNIKPFDQGQKLLGTSTNDRKNLFRNLFEDMQKTTVDPASPQGRTLTSALSHLYADQGKVTDAARFGGDAGAKKLSAAQKKKALEALDKVRAKNVALQDLVYPTAKETASGVGFYHGPDTEGIKVLEQEIKDIETTTSQELKALEEKALNAKTGQQRSLLQKEIERKKAVADKAIAKKRQMLKYSRQLNTLKVHPLSRAANDLIQYQQQYLPGEQPDLGGITSTKALQQNMPGNQADYQNLLANELHNKGKFAPTKPALLQALSSASVGTKDEISLSQLNPLSVDYDKGAEERLLKNKKALASVRKQIKGLKDHQKQLREMLEDVTKTKKDFATRATRAFTRRSTKNALDALPVVSGGMGDLPKAANLVPPVSKKAGTGAAKAVKSGLVKISTLVDKSIDDLVDQLPIAKFEKVEKDIIRQVAKATVATTPAGGTGNILKTGLNLMNTQVDEATAATIKAGLDRQIQDIISSIAKNPEIHSGKSGYVKKAKAELGRLFRGTNGSVSKILKNTTDLINSSNMILVDAVGSSTFALQAVREGVMESMTTLAGSGQAARIPMLAEEIQARRKGAGEVAASSPARAGQPNTRKAARDAAAAESRKQNDEILNRVLGEKPEIPPSTTPAVTENITATKSNTAAQVENTGATNAATTAEVKDKTVTTASTTATELKTTATNASAATIIMSKRGEELMNKANALLTSAKFQQVAAIDALISSYTAEQLSTKSGASLVKARDGVRSSLNTLEKAKAELLKREAATIKNGLGAQNSALVDAKKKLEIATKNASKRLTDLAKASTVMTDSLKATTVTPVTAKPAKAAPAAAAKAAAPFYPTPTGAPIPKAPGASRKVNVSSLPAGMKVLPTDSGVVKKLGELAVSFDKSLANFFKGPNFFQGPNIFQGKIISADKLKINITDKAKDASRLAKARGDLVDTDDPRVVAARQSMARRNFAKLKGRIETRTGKSLTDDQLASLGRKTGYTLPKALISKPKAPFFPTPTGAPVPIFPTPTGAAIPKATAFSGIKSKIDDVTKGVTKLGGMFSNVLPKAMHVTATAAVKSFTAVGRAVASSYAVNAVKAMTGGLKVVGSTANMLAAGFRISAKAIKVFNVISASTTGAIKSIGAAGLVTKTITSDMAWAFGKLGKILGSTVNAEMKTFLISLQRSKLTKAWTFMLTAGMMTFVKSLRVGIAHLNIFSNTRARLASARAAINGLTAGTSLLRKSLVGLNAFTGLSAGIQAAFSGILKSVLSVVSIVIKLNAALFLIAPVVLLISAIFIQLKRGTTNNSAALKLFKEGIVLIKGAVLALANPILDIINAFGGFTGATNQTQKTAGALYMMARAFKSVSQAFNNFAQGAGQRFVKNTLGPVIIRLVNRFILLGRAIRGAMRQDGSAGKNMSAFFQSLLYEGLNVMAKLFDNLSKLLPHMGGIIGAVIGAVAKASIKMLNLIGKFGMEVGLFFGSIISGIGLAMMAIPGIGTALGATIAAAGAALVGVSLAGFAASKALVKSDAEIDKWASGVGKSVANGMGSAASGMAGFIKKGMDSIDKSYAKKIGQGINKALVSTAGDPDGLKKAIEESLKKNADVAKSGGEALGAAAAKGMIKKMQDIKKTFTDGFFGKADAAVDKYVDSLKRGLEDQRDKALEAFDNQADAIQELADAEERLTSKIEYEEKKRLLIKTRALDQENYLRERKVAVYEGRTEDVRSLDLASQKSKTESTKEESDLDLSRLKTLQGEQRDKALAVIAREKELLAKEYEKMFRDFDAQIEKIKTVGFSTEDEFKTLLSRLGGASQSFSDAITETFSNSMLALPTAIRDVTDPSIGMFTVSMDKLVTEAQTKFGAANGIANSTSILGAAYNLATGMPDAFKTAFTDGIITQFVTPWSSKVTAEISGIIPSNLWVESAGFALIEMVNTLKRELVALKGTLWNDFKKIFEATSNADFASIFGPALAGLEDVKKYMTGLFGEVTQLASDINLIEINREQQSGGGGDEAKKPVGSALPGEASYVPSAYDRFEIRRGRGLSDRNKITPPVSDSGAEKSGGGFFGGIKDAAVGLADQLGAVKTAILGAVGAIAGFFVLQAVFGFISTVMGVIAGALLTVSIGAAAVVAAVGIVIGLFIYLYIKVKGFRDFVNGAFIAAWEALGAVIGFVWDGIKTGVSASLDAVKNFVQNALDFMKDVWGAIGGIVEDTFKKIISFFVDGFNALKDNIGGFVDSFINLFKGFWGAIGDGIKTIADPIMELLGKIGIAIGIAIGAIVAFAGGIVVVIVNIFDKIKGPLFSVTGFIIDIFSKIFDIATPIVEIGIGIIANLIALPFKILNTVIDIAVGAIKIAIDIIVGVFNVLFDVFKAIASNPIVVFFARLVALLGLVAAIAATWTIKIVLESTWYVIKKVVGALIDLAEFIVGGLVGAFNIIKDVAIAAWDFIYDKVKGFVDWWHENIGSLWLVFTAPVVTAYEAIMWLFNTVKDNLGPILSSVWDKFKSAIDVVWDVMKQVGSWISTVFSTIWDAIGTIAVAVFEGIKDALGIAWGVMKKVSSWIGTAFGAAWGVLKKAASLYWDYLSFVIPLFWETLKTVASWIGTVFSTVWDVVGYAATNAFQILGDAINIFWGIITAGYDFIKPVFDWLVDIVGNVIKTQIEGLGGIFGFLWNGIMAGYDFIKPVFDWIADIIGNIISTQVEGLKKIFGFLWDGIKAGWDLVGPIFGLMADIVGKVIKTAIDNVKIVWDLLWQGIQASWTFLKPIFDFIKDAITGGIGLAIDLIKAGWDLFVAALTNTKDFIMDIVGKIGGFIKDKIQVVIENLIGVWNGLKTAFSTVWGVIEPIISKIGGAIKSVIGGAIDFISAAISAIPQAFKLVVNSIGGLFNRAVDLLGNFAFPKTILGIPLPFIGGKKVSDFITLPRIPPLYNGGKVGMYMKGGMAYGTGGMTYGAGGMTNGPVQQGIPAILHGGEYVINHKAVQRIGTDTLERLNNYKLSKPNLPSMPSVPRINMPGAGMNAPQYAQSGSNSTQNVNIFVENFIGEPEWFNGMMKDYNTKVLPRNQKAAGVQSRVVSTYNGINKGL